MLSNQILSKSVSFSFFFAKDAFFHNDVENVKQECKRSILPKFVYSHAILSGALNKIKIIKKM